MFCLDGKHLVPPATSERVSSFGGLPPGLRKPTDTSQEQAMAGVLTPWDTGLRSESDEIGVQQLKGHYALVRWTDRWGRRGSTAVARCVVSATMNRGRRHKPSDLTSAASGSASASCRSLVRRSGSIWSSATSRRWRDALGEFVLLRLPQQDLHCAVEDTLLPVAPAAEDLVQQRDRQNVHYAADGKSDTEGAQVPCHHPGPTTAPERQRHRMPTAIRANAASQMSLRLVSSGKRLGTG
jgi:hypothetical protein